MLINPPRLPSGATSESRNPRLGCAPSRRGPLFFRRLHLGETQTVTILWGWILTKPAAKKMQPSRRGTLDPRHPMRQLVTLPERGAPVDGGRDGKNPPWGHSPVRKSCIKCTVDVGEFFWVVECRMSLTAAGGSASEIAGQRIFTRTRGAHEGSCLR